MGNFDMLPLEIMFAILSGLPVESVLQCKRVSKPWRNLLQHPSFYQMYLNHHNHHLGSADGSGKSSFISVNSSQFYYTKYDENLNRFSRPARNINLRPPFKHYYIIGSCNGLICFSAGDNINLLYKPAYICNPITREYILLPEVGGRDLLTGFGYCPSTNEYKVVSMCNYMCHPNFRIVQVYTLGSGTRWRNVTKMDYNKIIPDRQPGASVNGAIHWLDDKQTILAFDLADEEFRNLPALPRLPQADRLWSLLVLGDFLCACCSYTGSVGIWLLKGMIWHRGFTVSVDVTPITLTKSGGLLYYDYRDRLSYCHANFSRMLVEHGEDFECGVPYKITLVSLKALGEEDTKVMDPGGGETKF